MINAFSAVLEARAPALGRFRAYRLEAGPDLFGDWIVQVTYGRIGARGRSLRYSAPSQEDAQRLVRRCLRRRASAPSRIGVGYAIVELTDPWDWAPTRGDS